VGAGDKVEVRDVQATNWQRNQWLIEEGLHAGERVMVDGFQRVMPGAQVKPVAARGPAAAQAAAPTSAPQAEGTK